MARRPITAATDAQRQRILDAAEVVLRRFGPSKTNVVDVARELGQTHASVYRYFASKAELIEALVERWLARITEPLAEIARGPAPARDRLRAWVVALHEAKVRKVTVDPEHFAIFHLLASVTDQVAITHLADLVDQLARIIADGVTEGVFRVADPRRAALAVQNATLRFHHPALLVAPNPTPTRAELDDLLDLVLAGLAQP